MSKHRSGTISSLEHVGKRLSAFQVLSKPLIWTSPARSRWTSAKRDIFGKLPFHEPRLIWLGSVHSQRTHIEPQLDSVYIRFTVQCFMTLERQPYFTCGKQTWQYHRLRRIATTRFVVVIVVQRLVHGTQHEEQHSNLQLEYQCCEKAVHTRDTQGIFRVEFTCISA